MQPFFMMGWSLSMKNIRSVLVRCVLLLAINNVAIAEPVPVEEIRAAVDGHATSAIAFYRDFLGLPNDAQHADDIDKLVEWLATEFTQRGFETQRLGTAGNPALFAGRHAGSDKSTVLIYLQADGQPVDRAAWDQASPFLAVLKERDDNGHWVEIPWARIEQGIDADWRVFARSAADSKGPMTQFLMAIELLDDNGFIADYNLKVIVDTEEEMGSPNLADAIRANRALFAADL